jgi:PEP-CTERM motif
MISTCSRVFSGFVLAGAAGLSMAGPVILGGDDLTDHGSRSGAGANLAGWLYIEKAVSNVLSGVTRAGALTTDIVALGSVANPTFDIFNAGGAIGSVGNVLSKSVTYIDGAAAINQFFVDLAGGVINPGMLWFSGTGANNNLDGAEGAALTSNAAAINAFGASGGGIMAHGSGSSAYGWLSALLPGLIEGGGCNAGGATLTAAGQAAFPGLTNNDVNGNAGPCHSSFSGDFGGLTTLALDGGGLSYIIGGGAGTVIVCGQPGQPVCPPTNQVPEPSSLLLMTLAGLALAAQQRRRRSGVVDPS